ncbi:FxSxx-COOH cyclophane-containing RiPP peptide [Streptomyces sp. DSM 44917]|uniref:FxSxx-COOH cyclophane-containing RiPP peptide n=1 Tax=Streptomyces boetiae TaxID=3075541 RepID=A0ABU2LGE7_9ACTN|nr:FxSxx-COOH cyclophane-containing RiPP peptide [Streptomyces sp. DSM 44917]MDT0310530.1 FxSxx-COOH cyclophane-containing RiPP peptide [Streptomyces sp. DSM 44917]
MQSESGERASLVPDLTQVPLAEVLDGTDSALAQAMRRVLARLDGGEPPVAAYDSGGDTVSARPTPPLRHGPGA